MISPSTRLSIPAEFPGELLIDDEHDLTADPSFSFEILRFSDRAFSAKEYVIPVDRFVASPSIF